MKMDGFVIVPPLNPWDEKNKDKIWLDMAYTTFEPKEAHAWNRFIGYAHGDPDRSIKIQYWHDRGYRLKKATLEIIDD